MAKLYFNYGAMSSGKTTALLQVAHNYEEKGLKILLFKPSIDTKGDKNVVSRIGISREVDVILSKDDDIASYIGEEKPAAIIVDEAQFLTPEQVDTLYVLAKLDNIPVLCYGLRCDFQMKGFPGSTRLLEIADTIIESKTICSCGKKATQNLRKVNGEPTFDGDQVLIDGSTDDVTYEGVCGECYIKLKEKYDKKNKPKSLKLTK